MEPDARNSIALWVGAIALFGVFWAVTRFHWLDGLPRWTSALAAAAAILNLAVRAWLLWRRKNERAKFER